MAQGEAASLLVRIYLETGDERFAVSARRALLPLCVDSLEGGVRAALGKGSFPEEYPTQPPSCVLNGGIFALWGLYDVGVALDHASARVAFRQAVDTLAENLYRWDVGYWSRYDLFPHATTNIASSFYHDLHINQLRAMHRLVARRQLAETAEDQIPGILGRIQKNMDARNAAPDRHFPLSFSIGIVSGTSAKGSNLETLLSRADALMYQQKRSKVRPRGKAPSAEASSQR